MKGSVFQVPPERHFPSGGPTANVGAMSLEQIFPVLNQMEAEGVVGRYAIGGAVGAIFWVETTHAKNLDIFVALPTAPSGSLPTLGPVYDFLLGRGYRPEGQFIVMEGWSVEFVPPATPLVEEALADAVTREVNATTTRVFTAEHLAAICLQVGRARDHDRIERFIEAGVLDAERLAAILCRHGLLEQWRRLPQNPPLP